MPKFRYTGENKNGQQVQETVTATDRFEVYDIARKDGNTVITIDEGSTFSIQNFLDIEKINYFLSKVKEDELVMMTRNLGSMLVAGLPLTRCLSVIERQSKNPRLKGIINKNVSPKEINLMRLLQNSPKPLMIYISRWCELGRRVADWLNH